MHNDVVLDNGALVTDQLVREVLDAEYARLAAEAPEGSRLKDARDLFEQVALADEFVEFLTIPAYDLINGA